MKYEAIAKKIITLKNADLELRDQLIQTGQLGDGYNEEMAQLHDQNAAALDEIIDAIGYPTIAKVGKEASEAAWLVIQHAIGQPGFMKKCAALLEAAVEANQANPKSLAYLSDRIAVFEGRSQRYGTQFDWDEKGEMSPQPYDDFAEVNRRRISVGLNTLEEQTEIIRRQVKEEHQSSPVDVEQRRRAVEAWKQAVGWTT